LEGNCLQTTIKSGEKLVGKSINHVFLPELYLFENKYKNKHCNCNFYTITTSQRTNPLSQKQQQQQGWVNQYMAAAG